RTIIAIGPRGDFEAVGQRLARDHQRVVTRGVEVVRQTGEHTTALVPDARGLAMHDGLGPHHLAAVALAQALVTEADAENRRARAQLADQLDRNTGLVRRARPWRDHDAFRRQRLDL